MSFTSLLLDTFTHETKTNVADGQGGFTETWASAGTFDGRLSHLKANEMLATDKMTVLATHRIFCEATTTFTEYDRVILGSRTFEIRYVDDLDDGIGAHHIELTVLEID